MDFERICQNCSSFFQDPDDMNLGACLNDEVFEPFLDEIIDHEDFSICYELYLQKRYNGERRHVSYLMNLKSLNSLKVRI